MIKFKQLLESVERFREEERRRREKRIPQTHSRYLGIGHDDESYLFGLDEPNMAELAKIKRDVWGVSDQGKLPHLWASGPSITKNIKNNEAIVSVRPISSMEQTHADVFPDAYYTTDNGAYKSHPHVYGRIDHDRRVISMNTNHRNYFSNSSLDSIARELKSKFPNYDIHDSIGEK